MPESPAERRRVWSVTAAAGAGLLALYALLLLPGGLVFVHRAATGRAEASR